MVMPRNLFAMISSRRRLKIAVNKVIASAIVFLSVMPSYGMLNKTNKT